MLRMIRLSSLERGNVMVRFYHRKKNKSLAAIIFIIPVLIISLAVLSGIRTVHAQEISQAADIERNQAVIDQRVTWNRQEKEIEDAKDDLDSMGVPETVPTDIADICEQAGNHFNISPEMLMAIAWKESHFDPTAENGDCKGLMQVNVNVHSDKIKLYGGDWSDSRTSIYAAAMLISELTERGYDDLGSIMSMYHGEGTPNAYSSYTQDVGRISADYERIDGKYTY